MTMRSLMEQVATRIRSTRNWEQLRDELSAAFLSTEPIQMREPFKAKTYMRNEPAMQFFDIGGSNQVLSFENEDHQQMTLGIGLGSQGVVCNEMVPVPTYFVDQGISGKLFSTTGGNAGGDGDVSRHSIGNGYRSRGSRGVRNDNAPPPPNAVTGSQFIGSGVPGDSVPFVSRGGVGHVFVNQPYSDSSCGLVQLVWNGKRVYMLDESTAELLCSQGSISVGCCGNQLKRRLIATISNGAGCACANGEAALVYEPNTGTWRKDGFDYGCSTANVVLECTGATAADFRLDFGSSADVIPMSADCNPFQLVFDIADPCGGGGPGTVRITITEEA